MNKQLIRTSKALSKFLRHNPEQIGITLKEGGWADVTALLNGLKKVGLNINFVDLKEIVVTNDKKRFSFSEDEKLIRANQGHSLKVDLQLKAIKPPDTLYHGTAERFMPSIKKEGLIKRNRHHVHLTENIETAKNVGRRYGKIVLLKINTKQMHQDGYKFYCSTNGVWLVDEVLPKYYVIS